MKDLKTANDIQELYYPKYLELTDSTYYASLEEKDKLFYEFMTKDSGRLEFVPDRNAVPKSLTTESLLHLEARNHKPAYISSTTFGYLRNENGFRTRASHNVVSVDSIYIELDFGHGVSGRRYTLEEYKKILHIIEVFFAILSGGSYNSTKFNVPDGFKPTMVGFTGRGIVIVFKLKGNGIKISDYSKEVVQKAYELFTKRATFIFNELCKKFNLQTLDGKPLVCDDLANTSYNRIYRAMGTINPHVNEKAYTFYFKPKELDFLDYLDEAVDSLLVQSDNVINHRPDLRNQYLTYTNNRRKEKEYKATRKNPDKVYKDNLREVIRTRLNQMKTLGLIYLKNVKETGDRYHIVSKMIMSALAIIKRNPKYYNDLITFLVEFDNEMPKSWYKDTCEEEGLNVTIRQFYHNVIQTIIKARFDKNKNWTYGVSGKYLRINTRAFREAMVHLTTEEDYGHDMILDEFKYLFSINKRSIAKDNHQILTKLFEEAVLETLYDRETDNPKELKKIILKKLNKKIGNWQRSDIHEGLYEENFNQPTILKFLKMTDKVFTNLLKRFVYPVVQLDDMPKNFTEFVALFAQKYPIYKTNKRTGKKRLVSKENRRYKLVGSKLYYTTKECISTILSKLIEFTNKAKNWRIPSIDPALLRIKAALKEKIFYRDNGIKGAKVAKEKWQKEFDEFKFKIHKKYDFIYVENPKTGELTKEYRPTVLFNELYRKDPDLYKHRNEFVLHEFSMKFTDRKRYELIHCGDYETGEMRYFSGKFATV